MAALELYNLLVGFLWDGIWNKVIWKSILLALILVPLAVVSNHISPSAMAPIAVTCVMVLDAGVDETTTVSRAITRISERMGPIIQRYRGQ